MDKLALREAMLKLELDKLHSVEANYQDFLHQATVDNSESFDDDELSHALESSEIALLLDRSVHEHEEKISHLQEINFSAKSRVEPGAVVRFNNRSFIIAIATSQFECAGESYMGISTKAPVYELIEGLEAGDTFKLNDRTVKIQAVY